MLSYCLKCRKNAERKHPKVLRSKNKRIMLLWKFSVCNCKKSKFVKEQEAKGPLGNFLGAKLTILGDIPSVNTFLKKSIKWTQN